jgi:hypothetical protein
VFSWDATAASDGVHTLHITALDSLGNHAALDVPVTVDNTPPSLVVSAPGAGAVLRASVAIAVAAGDASGMAAIQLFDGATLLATLTAAPYEYSWDTTSVSDGAHLLQVIAVDSAGNPAELQVPVTVDNAAPTVTVESPAAGALLRASMPITVTTSDVSGVASVQLFDGATLLATLSAAPYEFTWDTTATTEGAHDLRVAALDAAGNLASVQVPVTVDNILPEVALSSPVSGVFGAGALTLTAAASDASGVARVSFFDNGSLLSVSTTAPYSFVWTPTAGAHSLTATATDAAGNMRTSVSVAVTIVTSQTAVYSTTYKAPLCATRSTACSSGSLLTGRGTVGPESNRPNTIKSTCADGNSGTYHATGESNDAITVESVSGGLLFPGASVRVNTAIWAVNTSDWVDIWSAPVASSPVWTLRQTLKPTVFGAASVVSTTFTLPAGAIQVVRVSLRRAGSATPCPSGSYNDHDDLVFATN